MTDLATLGLAVDSGPVKGATSALQDFSKAGKQAEQSATGVVGALGKGKDPVKAFASAFKEADANQGSYTKGANKVIDSLSDQFVRLQSTKKEWAQISAVQKAGVDINSDAADKIAKMAGALFDLEQGQKKTAAAANDNVKANRLWAGSGSQVIQALGLFGIGFGTVLSAATELYRYLNRNAPTTEKILQEQDRLVRIVKASYDDATKSAKNFFEQSKDVTRLQLLQQEIDLQQKLKEEVGKGISSSTTFGTIGDFFSGTKQVKEQFQAFEDAIFRLKDGFDQGTPNVREFADQVARIGLQNPELQKAAIDLIKNVGSASELAEKLKAIKSSLDLLDGKKLNNEGRASIGLSQDKSGENLAAAWDKQLASLSRRNAAMEAEARTVGQSDAAHEKMRTTLLLEDFLFNKGVKNIDAYREKIAQAGDEAAKTAEKLALARLASDIKFDRSQIGLSDSEASANARLRQAFGDNVNTAQAQFYKQQLMINDALRQYSDIGKDATKGFISDIIAGKNALESLGNALTKIGNKLIDMAVDGLWGKAFGGGSGGLLGGLGSLFGIGGGSSAAGSVGVVGAAGGMVVPTFLHGGGVVGYGGYQNGAFPASLFRDAPRFHNGSPGIGLKQDEIPAILQRGERVIPRGQNDNGGGNVINMPISVNASGNDPAAIASAIRDYVNSHDFDARVVSSVATAKKQRKLA